MPIRRKDQDSHRSISLVHSFSHQSSNVVSVRHSFKVNCTQLPAFIICRIMWSSLVFICCLYLISKIRSPYICVYIYSVKGGL
ncbi:hypothetical protein GDO78_003715 [Eleutherodactylus coqui]|uniref:Uncharacterized protein n=1 Tax=Eleutherodactylus coqui TaxID=57060 RepID=A0A8J6EUQ5_ELECQ|nr:hypothetical protein GDO78_003715 [Eleutherodactylus coqui]